MMTIARASVAREKNRSFWRKYIYRVVAQRINSSARYFDSICQIAPLPEDDGALLEALVDRTKNTVSRSDEIPQSASHEGRRFFVLNGNLNHDTDIEGTLRKVHERIDRGDRVCLVIYNFYLAWIYRVANFFGLRKGPLPSTFVTENTLKNLVRLAGFEIVGLEYTCHIPVKLFGLGNFMNRFFSILPLVRKMALD